ncbi:hypothetical protein SAMN05444156_2159 [Verrucomicrobium sp. GAS474]|uniref:hypothetical protein n=1 Tax=Verrucomicrobium sp. GAS474 TaxID=1882831 RepID=UPI00087CDD17|nr:hypothetical protein [Verrucomicrobium sp. GAS474]SDU13378.1 hypothetical protein SAMN05444156_2159 [Verrucomicrobium sp. GAS474]
MSNQQPKGPKSPAQLMQELEAEAVDYGVGKLAPYTEAIVYMVRKKRMKYRAIAARLNEDVFSRMEPKVVKKDGREQLVKWSCNASEVRRHFNAKSHLFDGVPSDPAAPPTTGAGEGTASPTKLKLDGIEGAFKDRPKGNTAEDKARIGKQASKHGRLS